MNLPASFKTTATEANLCLTALVFRPIGVSQDAPTDGQLFLCPAKEACHDRHDRHDRRDRRDLAKPALERGVDGFVRGMGSIRCIVLPIAPTFDDLLAAEFVTRLSVGEDLPPGAQAFAECAKLIREGVRPGEVPFERSIEGIFLAIVNNAGSDLSKPGAAEQFCRDWPRMARRVMDAAQRGVDPFTTPLFDDAEFARERAYLARDREVYRQDVTRGERWIVSVYRSGSHFRRKPQVQVGIPVADDGHSGRFAAAKGDNKRIRREGCYAVDVVLAPLDGACRQRRSQIGHNDQNDCQYDNRKASQEHGLGSFTKRDTRKVSQAAACGRQRAERHSEVVSSAAST